MTYERLERLLLGCIDREGLQAARSILTEGGMHPSLAGLLVNAVAPPVQKQ